ncbi:MAG: hypothetical protein KDK66_01470 [Deltaproteobacteria bacterium]|nr:hypothetical protein [Deltaproteobacteria bacterium]
MFLKIKKISLFILSLVLTFSLAGGFGLEAYAKKDKSNHSSVKKSKSEGGPPDHAPAHGYRRKKQLEARYYSSANKGVYYYYFPQENTYVWRIKKGDDYVIEFGRRLPQTIVDLALRPVRSAILDAPLNEADQVDFSLFKINLNFN